MTGIRLEPASDDGDQQTMWEAHGVVDREHHLGCGSVHAERWGGGGFSICDKDARRVRVSGAAATPRYAGLWGVHSRG